MDGAVPVGLGRRGALRDQGQVLYIHGRQVTTGAGTERRRPPPSLRRQRRAEEEPQRAAGR